MSYISYESVFCAVALGLDDESVYLVGFAVGDYGGQRNAACNSHSLGLRAKGDEHFIYSRKGLGRFCVGLAQLRGSEELRADTRGSAHAPCVINVLSAVIFP